MTVKVARVGWNDIRRHEQAASVIKDRSAALSNELEVEAAEMRKHRQFVDAFAEKMKLGSALGDHPERVLDWLIEVGWKPSIPALFLTEEDSDG